MQTHWDRALAWRWARPFAAVALCTLWIGSDGSVRDAHADEDCTSAQPGAGDYCASNKCGPCLEDEGDCDPGQCQAGLTCAEEGAVDHCRPTDPVCDVPVGASDYCSSSQCGPCPEGAGDCDDASQCGAGLECVEEGTIDRCRAPAGACLTSPSSIDYCEACGPCGVGEGDCEAGQCEVGLVCAEEGAIDRCRAGSGLSNLEVQVDGVWEPVCCVDGEPAISDEACWWTEYGRLLTDEYTGLELDCPEGAPTSCRCDGSGERMHSVTGDLAGLRNSAGSTFYSDYQEATCVVLDGDGELETVWTDASCLDFRLR